MKSEKVLHFTAAGKGAVTLIFLHYFGGSSKTWAKVIAELSHVFKCIAIDLPGSGDSQHEIKSLSVNGCAGKVAQLITFLGIKQYALIGHSMGGKIALSVASRQPAGLRSIVLIAPSPPTPEPTTDTERSALIDAFRIRPEIEKIVKRLTAKPLEHKLFESTVNDHFNISHSAWDAWLQKGSLEDISGEMHKITVPLLVVSGSTDPNFSTGFLRQEFSRYFVQAQFAEVSEAGHLIPLEKPVVASVLINSFAGK